MGDPMRPLRNIFYCKNFHVVLFYQCYSDAFHQVLVLFTEIWRETNFGIPEGVIIIHTALFMNVIFNHLVDQNGSDF